ncbi:uncharacterized protein TNCV_1026051 [Trichonephila clavipes]|nr:uncharacterized protein TNCV_1026051 [Trichonephila clavipes]
MEVPLRTAYGQNGRCGMQPKAKHSLRAQAQLMRTETVETFELVKVKQKLLDIRDIREKGERERVLFNEVLTEFLDDIQLAVIQRLLVPACVGSQAVHDWLDIAYPGHWIRRQDPVLWSPRSPDLTPLDFFPIGPSQGTDVSRCSDNTNGLSCLSACCCTSVDPAVLRHGMTAFSRRAQACLYKHGGHFEHLP